MKWKIVCTELYLEQLDDLQLERERIEDELHSFARKRERLSKTEKL